MQPNEVQEIEVQRAEEDRLYFESQRKYGKKLMKP